MKFVTAGTLGGVIYLQTLLVNGQPILVSADGITPISESINNNPDVRNNFHDRVVGQSTFHSRKAVIAPSSVVMNHIEKIQPQTRSESIADDDQLLLQRRSPKTPGRIDAKELRALNAANEGGAPSWLHVDGSNRRATEEVSEALVRRGKPNQSQSPEGKGTVVSHSDVPQQKGGQGTRPEVKEWRKVESGTSKPPPSEEKIEALQNSENLGHRLGTILKESPEKVLEEVWPKYGKREETEKVDYLRRNFLIDEGSLLIKRNDPKKGTNFFQPKYELLEKAQSQKAVDQVTKRLHKTVSFNEEKLKTSDTLTPWKGAAGGTIATQKYELFPPDNKERRLVNENEERQLVRRGISLEKREAIEQLMMKGHPPSETRGS